MYEFFQAMFELSVWILLEHFPMLLSLILKDISLKLIIRPFLDEKS